MISISNSSKIIDSRDINERIEELENNNLPIYNVGRKDGDFNEYEGYSDAFDAYKELLEEASVETDSLDESKELDLSYSVPGSTFFLTKIKDSSLDDDDFLN